MHSGRADEIHDNTTAHDAPDRGSDTDDDDRRITQLINAERSEGVADQDVGGRENQKRQADCQCSSAREHQAKICWSSS